MRLPALSLAHKKHRIDELRGAYRPAIDYFLVICGQIQGVQSTWVALSSGYRPHRCQRTRVIGPESSRLAPLPSSKYGQIPDLHSKHRLLLTRRRERGGSEAVF